MNDTTWKTEITNVQPNEIRLRGYRIDELIGSATFTEAIYLALIGDLPDNRVAQMLDAIFVSSIDHGPATPSTLAARTAASTGAALNTSVAAGLLSINQYHGGAIENCMNTLSDGIASMEDSNKTITEVADEIVNEYQAKKIRIAGLGHRLHTDDPRTSKLFTLATDLELAGNGMKMLLALQAALAERGKNLPINVDGAIAAILVDLDIPSEISNAFFFIARIPGLVAQVHEEKTRERPMRRIHPTKITYDGPTNRSISSEA